MRAFPLVALLLGCSAGSPPDSTSSRDPTTTAPPVFVTPDASAPSDASSPVSPAPTNAPPSHDLRVTEVYLVPHPSGGVSVTIHGTGFCKGAMVPEAWFGSMPLERIVVGATTMSGMLPSRPPAGAKLRVHTPPCRPVDTDYVVP